MSFSNSRTVRVPLSDPIPKYGKTFRVSNIYLNSSSQAQKVKDLNESSSQTSYYNQDFENKYLSVEWNIIDPKNDYEYKISSDIETNEYISGFNVDVYKNYGDLTGQNAIDNGEKVFSATGIKNNSIEYEISDNDFYRNYSVEVTLIDFTGNKSVGLLTTQNPNAEFNIPVSGMESGIFTCNYIKPTGENGEDKSHDLQYVTLYDFTGLQMGTFPGVDNSARSVLSKNGYLEIELTPGTANYIMSIASDSYSSGSPYGFFKDQEYLTGTGFTGYLGRNDEPFLIDYYPEVSSISGGRISGADAYHYEFEVNYDTGSNLLHTVYGITGTGQTSGSVSGYDGQIFFDSGVLFDTSYNENNTGLQYIYDNSLSLHSGFFTGELIDVRTVTGVGFTGSGTYGSGAGHYWQEGFPKYTGYESTGAGGEIISGGFYDYGYFDPYMGKFKCASYSEVKSENQEPVGIYSMPKNNPNSYDIKYRSTSNFTKTYEQAASYLNSIGEMPAVILNPSQLNKLVKINGDIGWVGLRRNNVAVLTGIFTQDFDNQSFFDGTNFDNELSRDLEFINSSGLLEMSRLEVNNVGNDWCWTNSSGTHIYKYAGSGYEKTRSANISFDIIRDIDGRVISSTGHTAEAPPMEISEITAESGNQTVKFDYKFTNQYFETGSTNYNVVQMNLYGGTGEGFIANNGSLLSTHYITDQNDGSNGGDLMQGSISYKINQGYSVPEYFKLMPFDTIGSGILANVNELAGQGSITTNSNDQATIISLDGMHFKNSNCIDVEFPFAHQNVPVVTFGLNYTGSNDNVSYLGAMIASEPSKSSVRFVLTNPPPSTGYALNVRSIG